MVVHRLFGPRLLPPAASVAASVAASAHAGITCSRRQPDFETSLPTIATVTVGNIKDCNTRRNTDATQLDSAGCLSVSGRLQLDAGGGVGDTELEEPFKGRIERDAAPTARGCVAWLGSTAFGLPASAPDAGP